MQPPAVPHAIAGPRFDPAPANGRLPWFAIAAVTLGAAGLAVFIEGLWPAPAAGGSPLSVHASILAGLLVAHSAVLYLVDALAREGRLGRAASVLAAIGAAMLVGSSLVRWFEAEWLLPAGMLSYAGQYEFLGWLAALAVLGCLVIEEFYRSRIPGRLIMPPVAGALGLAVWLMAVSPATEAGPTALIEHYLADAWLVCASVGAGSFLLIGATLASRSACRLCRGSGATDVRAAGPADHKFFYDPVLRWAVLVGLSATTLALVFDVAHQLIARFSAPPIARETALGVIWLGFGSLFLACRSGRRSSALVVRWVAVATLLAAACVLGQRAIASP